MLNTLIRKLNKVYNSILCLSSCTPETHNFFKCTLTHLKISLYFSLYIQESSAKCTILCNQRCTRLLYNKILAKTPSSRKAIAKPICPLSRVADRGWMQNTLHSKNGVANLEIMIFACFGYYIGLVTYEIDVEKDMNGRTRTATRMFSSAILHRKLSVPFL